MMPACQGRRCRARFWVCELLPPIPALHLIRTLGAEGAKGVLERVTLPAETTKPIYLQILLSGNEHMTARRSGILFLLTRAAA